MNQNASALERAFEIARSGKATCLGDIRFALSREGYNAAQLEGPQLKTQLRKLIKGARTPIPAS